MIQHRAKRIFFNASLLALGLAYSLPAFAQDADKTKEPKLVIELKALTETFEGLRSKESDTIAAGGGKLEGAILSAYAIKAAAVEIKNDSKISEKILVAGYGDAISSDVYAVYQLEYAQLCKRLGGCANVFEATQDSVEKLAPLALVGAILPALSSLLRSETEVSSLDDGLKDDRLLAYAVAREYKENAIVLMPPTLTSISPNDETIKELNALKKARDDVAAKKPNPKKKAAVDAADAFFTALYTADKDGNIKLLDVIKARQIAEAMQDRKLLRVKIENSSGTLLKRKNLWVALGAPAIAASGGLIATYALDEGNGTSVTQGMVLCQAGVKNLRKIHKLDENHNSHCKML
jgi:hypothetical protein